MGAGGRTTRCVVAVTFAAIVVAGLGAPPAEAKSWYVSGRPGEIATSAYATANGATRRIVVHPTTAGAAPAYTGYWQKVCITKRLWQIVFTAAGSGGQPFWKQVASSQACAWVTGNGMTYDDAVSFPAGYQKGYSVSIDVTWRLSNGYLIGSKTVDFDAVRDYRCVNGNCTTGVTNWGGGAFVLFPSS
jgi:hypothetical protein